MKLVDANVILYADDVSASHHAEARSWLTTALSAHEPLVIPWLCVVAYLRISTAARPNGKRRTMASAMEFIRVILDARPVTTGHPDDQHLERMSELLDATGHGGNLVNDAHLAALALQYDAMVISYDNDFGRFPGVRWERPAARDV